MADGGTSGSIKTVSTYRNRMTSLSKDFDGDGLSDVYGAATSYNIDNAIDTYKTSLTSLDHLFIFIVGDSEYDPLNYKMGTDGIAYLKLWNETIPPSDMTPSYNYNAVNFALSLYNVPAKTTMLLDISNSEDFVANLEEAGYQGTVMTSGRGNGLVFHSTYPYGRFVYNWLCDMNYQTDIHDSNLGQMIPFVGDPNNNRYITMEEAFNYANSHESQIYPYYNSAPITWGRYMSFDDVARDADLYIRHSRNDTGNEYVSSNYNPFFGTTTSSPDIYLRNQQDGGIHSTHDTLDLSQPGKKAYLYVKIHNDNNMNYPATGQYLHVFWADTRNLSLPVPHHTTVDVSDLNSTMYGSIASVPITNSISTGDSLLLCCEWNVPACIYSFKQQHGLLPPLSYVALLSEHPTLSCDSLRQLKRYANRTVTHKYAGLKAEFTYGYSSGIGPVVPFTPFMRPASNILTLSKPMDSDRSSYYYAMSDNPEIRIETIEDDENIYVALYAVNGSFPNTDVNLHLAKIEIGTDTYLGGVDIVLKDQNESKGKDRNTFNGKIRSVETDSQYITLTLTEPAVEGLQLCVESLGITVVSNTYNIEGEQTVITVPVASGSGNIINVSLVYNNVIIDSSKFVQ